MLHSNDLSVKLILNFFGLGFLTEKWVECKFFFNTDPFYVYNIYIVTHTQRMEYSDEPCLAFRFSVLTNSIEPKNPFLIIFQNVLATLLCSPNLLISQFRYPELKNHHRLYGSITRTQQRHYYLSRDHEIRTFFPRAIQVSMKFHSFKLLQFEVF